MFRISLLLALILLLPVRAQETMIRQVFDPVTDTHVEVLALFSTPSPSGYFPVRVKIANNLKDDREITLDFESSGDYSSDLKTRSTFNLKAAAGKTVTRDFMIPLCPGDTSWVRADLSGGLGPGSYTLRDDWDSGQAAVLLSEALFTPNGSALDSVVAGGSSYGSHHFSSKFDPKQLPDDWRAFSGFDSILMTDSDWTSIPPGGRNAILSWVRLGGQLILYSPSSAKAASLGLPEEPGFGTIAIHPIPSDLRMSPPGVLATVSANPNKSHQQSMHNDFQSSWPLQQRFGEQQFHYALFVVVMIVFAILVGPINLFVFAKSGQRHRLFITTPIISLGASLLMIGLIILQDGFGGSGMRRVLMEVRPDADVNAAYLHQEQFSRTGVLSNSRFTLDTPAFFQPVVIHESRWARFTSRMKGSFNLQPADGKMIASGDWWQSRSEQGHRLSAVIPTRGRIEKAPDGLLSTFEFPIDTIFYLDPANQWHRADGITAGKKFTLQPVDESMVRPALQEQSAGFADSNRRRLALAAKRQGHFIAITSHAPGIATNPSIRWKETRTVITGPVL